MAGSSDALYLGFDLSTQQLKCLAISSSLKLVDSAVVDFDADLSHYGITKGVLSEPAKGAVYASPLMWLEAVDLVLSRLREKGLDFSRVKGVSGAGMQHGTVFWSEQAEHLLTRLDGRKDAGSLVQQLGGKTKGDDDSNGKASAFSHEFSPNWQDASTQSQCDRFDDYFPGKESELAETTGSKAHHRFSGPQIMRFRERHPDKYAKTSRISLVSSFLASVLLGSFAPIDISDVCGMNLWHIKRGRWHEGLLSLVAGSDDSSATESLKAKLGSVPEDGGACIGTISPYFVSRYGFRGECRISPFTGDNPSTILALPLQPSDAMVSLGTSTTFLMATPVYKPDPSYHFLNSPTTAGINMFMLCYKNGGLAREKVRDEVNALSPDTQPPKESKSWDAFNDAALSAPTPGSSPPSSEKHKIALYFPRHEIVPSVDPGTYRYLYTPTPAPHLSAVDSYPSAKDDARAILESQFLSLRLRSRNLVTPQTSQDSHKQLPAQPRRIYLVGGGSVNPAIARLAGDVLGGAEGVYRLDIGGNACALGAAYKAAWSAERKMLAPEIRRQRRASDAFGTLLPDDQNGDHVVNTNGAKGATNTDPKIDAALSRVVTPSRDGAFPDEIRGGRDTESFEEFVGARWNEEDFVEKIDQGYREGVFEGYGWVLEGFEKVEEDVLKRSAT